MRHLRAGRKLGRNATHRLALYRNLARALILSEHGRIITTVAKAKEARKFVDKLITLAKKGTPHARRLALQRLHNKSVIDKLFDEIGPRFQDRAGGYTRVVKRLERRLGDAGHTAFLELLKEGEVKTRTRAPAPAPAVAPPAPQAETPPETPPASNEPTAAGNEPAPGGETQANPS